MAGSHTALMVHDKIRSYLQSQCESAHCFLHQGSTNTQKQVESSKATWLCPDLGFKIPFLNERNQSSLEKCSVAGLWQEKFNVTLVHLWSKSKKMFEKG